MYNKKIFFTIWFFLTVAIFAQTTPEKPLQLLYPTSQDVYQMKVDSRQTDNLLLNSISEDQEMEILWVKEPSVTGINLYLINQNDEIVETIAENVSGTSFRYTPAVPLPEDTYRIKITDTGNTNISDFSVVLKADFTISVDSPTIGTIWNLGDNITIQYDAAFDSYPGTIKFAILKTDGTYDTSLINNGNFVTIGSEATNATQNWTIPIKGSGGENFPNAESKVRILVYDQYGNPTSFAQSNSFRFGGWLDINALSSALYQSSANVSVDWEASSEVSSVKVELLDNGGNPVDTKTGITSDPYVYQIPDGQYGQNFNIRVTDEANSDANLTETSTPFDIKRINIVNDDVALTLDGTKWLFNDEMPHQIVVETGNITTVKIKLMKGVAQVGSSITSNVSNGSNTITIDALTDIAGTDGTDYSIVVEDNSNSSITDQSTTFSIETRTLSISNLSDGDILALNESKSLSTTNTNVSTILYYYKFSGGNETAFPNPPNVPTSTVAEDVQIIVRDSEFPTRVYDTKTIDIRSITNLAASGTMKKNSTPTISWQRNGVNFNVDIYVKKPSDPAYVLVTSNLNANSYGSYQFTEEGLNKVKVQHSGSSNVYAELDVNIWNMEITNLGNISTNNFAEVGEQYTIQWSATNINFVDVVLYNKSTSSVQKIIKDNADASTGSYSWTVGDYCTDNNFVIKLIEQDTDITGDQESDESSQFEIKKLTVTLPTSDWFIQADQTITYSSCNIDNFEIVFLNGSTEVYSHPVINPADGQNTESITAVDLQANLTPGTYSIKVRGTGAESSIEYQPSGTFEIYNKVITLDTSGEIWKAGNTHTIEWTRTTGGEKFTTVSLYYNAGSGNILIASGITASTDSYSNWVIPESAIGESVTLLIQDDDDPTLVNDSETITIRDITISSPTANLSERQGNSITISGTKSWTGNATIEADNGSGYVTIATVSSQTFSVPWTPNAGNYTLRIKSAGADGSEVYETVSGIKIWNLEITSIGNISTNSFAEVGEQYTITWDATNVNFLDIILWNKTSSAVATTIKDNATASAGTFSWTVGDYCTGDDFAIILREQDTEISGEQSSLESTQFEIKKLGVTLPTTEWFIQSDQIVSYNSCNIDNFEIVFLNGSTEVYSHPVINPSDGQNTESITAADLQANLTPGTYSIKVRGTGAESSIEYQPSGTFEIYNKVITLDTSGEIWKAGNTHTINWTRTTGGEKFTTVSLYYNAGSGNQLIASNIPASSESYSSWVIPDNAIGENVTILIEDDDNPTLVNDSETITIRDITISSPTANLSERQGNAITISGTKSWTGNATIEADNGSGYVTIATVSSQSFSVPWTPNAGNYTLRIKSAGADGSEVFETIAGIKIWNLEITSIGDISTNSFAEVGEQYTINWNATNVTFVDVILWNKTSSSVAATLKDNATASAGTFTWTVGDYCTGDNFAIILREQDTEISGEQSSLESSQFEIKKLQVTLPTTAWFMQNDQTVSFTSCNIDNFEIVLLSGSTEIYTQQVSNPSDGQNTETITAANLMSNLTTGSYSIKVRGIGPESTIEYAPSGTFEVYDKTVSLLTTAVIWKAGNTKNITWDLTSGESYFNNVDLYYDTGSGETLIASDITASLESYEWIIPESAIGENVTLTIKDSDDPTTVNDSETIKIRDITIANPTTNLVSREGNVITIQGTKSWTGDAAIEYSTDGQNFTSLTTKNTTSFSYDWTPTAGNYTFTIRVRSTGSDANEVFETVSNITVWDIEIVAPTNSVLKAGDQVNIDWTSAGLPSGTKYDVTLEGAQDYTLATDVSDTKLDNALINTSLDCNDYELTVSVTGQPTLSGTKDVTVTKLDISAPTAGSNLVIDATRNIVFSECSGGNPAVTIELIGTSSYIIAQNQTSPFVWTIGKDKDDLDVNPGTYTMRISRDVNGETITDEIANLNLVQTSISNVTPDGDELIEVGIQRDISWSSQNVNSVNIYLVSSTNGTITIASDYADGSPYTEWTPTTDQSGTDWRLRVENADNAAYNNINPDYSDDTFSIGWIDISKPTLSGQGDTYIFLQGTTNTIQWSANSNIAANEFVVQYIDSSNSSNSTTISGTPTAVQTVGQTTTWELSWNTGVPATENSAIFIYYKPTGYSYNANNAIDDINGDLIIRQIDFLTPAASNAILANKDYLVTWTNGGYTYSSIDITLYDNTGTPVKSELNIADDGQHNFVIPNVTGDGYYFIIQANGTENSHISAQSTTFPISNLSFATPTSLTSWLTYDREDNKETIDWNFTNVKSTSLIVSLLNSDSSSIGNITTINDPAATTEYSWNVGAHSGGGQSPVDPGTYRIKLTDPDNSNVSIISDAFTIFDEQLALVTPAGGESIQLDDIFTIDWTPQGDYTGRNVYLYLVTPDSTHFINQGVTVGVEDNSSTFSWEIDSVNYAILASNDAQLKITDTDTKYQDYIFDLTNKFVVGDINISSPNPGSIHQAGTTMTLTVETSENIEDQFDIMYRLNDQDTWKSTSGTITEVGSYAKNYFNQYTYTFTPSTALASETFQLMAIRKGDDANDTFKIDYTTSLKLRHILVTNPADAESVPVQYDRVTTIEWDKYPNDLDVSVKLVQNQSGSYVDVGDPIVKNTTADSYEWTPNVYGNDFKIVVYDSNNPTLVLDESRSFNIKKLDLVQTYQRFARGTIDTIVFNDFGISQVEIQIKPEGQGNYYTIESPVETPNEFPSGSTEYIWESGRVVGQPDLLSKGTYTLYLRSIDFPSMTAYGTVEIGIDGIESVNTPTLNQNLQVKRSYDIEFEVVGEVTKADIYLNTNPFGDDNLIKLNGNNPISTVTGINTWNWNLTNVGTIVYKNLASDENTIIIKNYDYPDVKNAESSVFRIGWIDPVEVDKNLMQANKLQTTTWNMSDNIDNVRLMLYHGSDSTTIVTSTSDDATEYIWRVGNISNDSAYIRVIDVTTGNYDIWSESTPFVITKLEIDDPVANVIHANGQNTISWQKSSDFHLVNIYYLDSDGNSNIVQQNYSGTEYTWTPTSLCGTNYKLYITDDRVPQYFASDTTAAFEIRQLYFTNATSKLDEYQVGDTYTISWISCGSTDFTITLLDSAKNTVPVTFPDQTTSGDTTSVLWTVDELDPGNYTIVVKDNEFPQQVYIEHDVELINQAVTVLSPNGNENWAQNDKTYYIKWYSENYRDDLKVRLSFSSDNGATWDETAIRSVPVDANLDSIGWKLTDPKTSKDYATDSAKVKVALVGYEGLVEDVSDYTFRIGWIQITAPISNDVLQKGKKFPITWDASSNIETVIIYYRTSTDTDWVRIVETENDGEYADWAPPESGSTYQIKVADILTLNDTLSTETNKVYDFEHISETFGVGELQFSKPNSNTKVVQINKPYTIEWTKESVGAVNVKLLTANGSIQLHNQAIDSTSLLIDWSLVEGEIGQNYYLILETISGNAADTSATFTLTELEVDTPNELGSFERNETMSITWTHQFVDNINISLYDTKKDSVIKKIAENHSASSGQYDWKVNSNIPFSINYVIQITDALYPTKVIDQSDTTFAINVQPKLIRTAEYSKDSVSLIFEYHTEENLTIQDLEYSLDGQNWGDSNQGGFGFIESPAENTIFTGEGEADIIWTTVSNVVGTSLLTDYEGPVYVRLVYTAQPTNVIDTIYLDTDTLVVDNKPPTFEMANLTIEQNLDTLKDWNTIRLMFDQITDYSAPVKAYVFLHDSVNGVRQNDIVYKDSVSLDEAVIKDYKNFLTDMDYYADIIVSDQAGNWKKITKQFTMRKLFDFNKTTDITQAIDNDGDDIITVEDFLGYVYAWNKTDYIDLVDVDNITKDEFPSVLINGNKDKNVDDIIKFIDFWNYSHGFLNKAPKRAPMMVNNQNLERKQLNVGTESERLSFAITPEQDGETMAVWSTKVYYNPEVMKLDSLEISSENGVLNGFTVTDNDTVNGILSVNYMNLNLVDEKQYTVSASMISKLDRKNDSDSMYVDIKGYNIDAQTVAKNNIIYSIKQVPDEFRLYQNYPNPFNPVTTLQYDVPQNAKVSLMVYNILGEQVAQLVNEVQEPGYYKIEFNSSKIRSGLASGVYLYRIVAGDFVSTKKMVLIK